MGDGMRRAQFRILLANIFLATALLATTDDHRHIAIVISIVWAIAGVIDDFCAPAPQGDKQDG